MRPVWAVFVRPKTGESFAPTRSRVNVERMTDALGALARHADPDGKRLLVVIVGNAGWHRAGRLVAPPNVRLHVRPRAPRRCNPPNICGRWFARLASDTFDTPADLRRRVVRRCRWLADDTTTVQRAVGFHWAVDLEV